MRLVNVISLCGLALVALSLTLCTDPAAARSNAAAAMPQAADKPKFLGAPTCSGPACHGRAEPTGRDRSQQIEFTIWSTKDKHSQAFDALGNELSLQMARLLKMPKPPQESERCLNCHSMNVLEPARRGQDFKLSDGVSCDGCHGPAERWFGTHLNEPYAMSLEKGMKDIRNPLTRAEMCLSCHLGNHAEGKIVDHEMFAAGHPPLEFELNTFSRRMPQHWRDKTPDPDGKHLPRAANWAAGQIVTLRDAARLIANDAARGPWPEYAHFDCSACHHDLKPDSWRQRRPSPGAIGRPTWQGSIPAALSITDHHAPSADDAIAQLQSTFAASAFGERDAVANRAATVADRLDELVRAIPEPSHSASAAQQLALKICSNVETIAWRGPAAAQQLTFALDSLLDHLRPSNSILSNTLVELHSQLDADRQSYDPDAIIRLVRLIAKSIE